MIPRLKEKLLGLPVPLIRPWQGVWRRLPPADPRFLLNRLDDERRRRAFLASPTYARFAAIEGRHWSTPGAVAPDGTDAELSSSAPGPARGMTSGLVSTPPRRPRYFAEHPLAQAEMHRRACPQAPSPWHWLAERHGGCEQALALGAGHGDHCRNLVDFGIARRVQAYDIAEEAVRAAQREFDRLGYPIRYRVGDLNFVPLGDGAYDLALAMHSLHHLIDLEGALGRVARALRPGGLFVSEDYVGPRFLQFPAPARRLMQELFEELPERLRLAPDGGSVLRRLYFPDRWAVQRSSPFEAIRADRILPLVEQYFEIEHLSQMGGALPLMLLNPVIHNFDPADEEANAWLRRIMAQDETLTREGRLPNTFAFIVARPKE